MRNIALGLSNRLQIITSINVPKETSPSHGTSSFTCSASFSRPKYSAMTGNEPTFCVSNRVLASMLGPPWKPSWSPKDAVSPSFCHDQPAPKGAERELLVRPFPIAKGLFRQATKWPLQHLLTILKCF